MITVLWLGFALIWGLLIKIFMKDLGLGSAYWWANTAGHCIFGCLWILTCIDKSYSRVMHGPSPSFKKCIFSLVVAALAWEFGEYFYDQHLLSAGMIPAQKGGLDTTSDICTALFFGAITWVVCSKKTNLP